VLIQNISPNPITLAGVNVIPANGGSLDIPYYALEDERKLLGYLDAQQLRILEAEESFTLRSVPRFTQGQLFSSQAVGAGGTLIPTISGTATPLVLWLAPFQNVRLYLQVTEGDATLTVQDSPDGGVTFYPVPDAPAMQAQATENGPGLTSARLPQGLVAIQCTITSQQGGVCSLSYSRQT